jgi:hypothetical protein
MASILTVRLLLLLSIVTGGGEKEKAETNMR